MTDLNFNNHKLIEAHDHFGIYWFCEKCNIKLCASVIGQKFYLLNDSSHAAEDSPLNNILIKLTCEEYIIKNIIE